MEGWRSTIELHPHPNADIVLLLQGHVKFDEKTGGASGFDSNFKLPRGDSVGNRLIPDLDPVLGQGTPTRVFSPVLTKAAGVV